VRHAAPFLPIPAIAGDRRSPSTASTAAWSSDSAGRRSRRLPCS